MTAKRIIRLRAQNTQIRTPINRIRIAKEQSQICAKRTLTPKGICVGSWIDNFDRKFALCLERCNQIDLSYSQKWEIVSIMLSRGSLSFFFNEL